MIWHLQGREMGSYLDRLPQDAQFGGAASKGEIQLVGETPAVHDITADRRERLRSRGLYAAGNELGIVFEDEYVLVVRDPVRFPSGTMGTHLRIFERSGLDGATGSVAVAVRGGELYLRRVFRHATRSWQLECPRGFRSPDESGDEAVRRELDEELGIPVLAVERLGDVFPNTGLLASSVESYFVTLGPGAVDSRPETREAFGEIRAISFKAIRSLVAAGEIRDGISLSAIFQAEARGFLRPDTAAFG